MNSEVHSRQGNENADGDRYDAKPDLLVGACDSTEESYRGLRVTAGEGVSRCRLARRLNYGKIGIFYPRARNSADDFQKLVDHSSDKSGAKQVIALRL